MGFAIYVWGVHQGKQAATHHQEIRCPDKNVCAQLQQANPSYEVIYYP